MWTTFRAPTPSTAACWGWSGCSIRRAWRPMSVAPAQVLLVFRRGMTREDSETSGGMVPGHHSEGPAHFAFAIDAADYDAWKAHLAAAGVAIVSEVRWPPGGKSLYFDDPDGNVVELATPGLWPNY